VILVICLEFRAPSLEPGRFGWLGERLADLGIAEIGKIASSAGGRPWLVLGHRSMALGVASLDVYLQPDGKGGRVSRGRLLRLIADDSPTVERRSLWRVRETKSYAYITTSGSPLFEVTREQDVGWPLRRRGRD
jgi:hypothetical protein